MSSQMTLRSRRLGAELGDRSASFLPDLLAWDAERRAAHAADEADMIGLLAEHSTAWQQTCLRRGYLVARGSHTHALYWVGGSLIARLDQPPGIVAYCIHPVDRDVSRVEQMLAAKLLIETDEQRFLRLGNEAGTVTGDDRDFIERELDFCRRMRSVICDPTSTDAERWAAIHRFTNTPEIDPNEEV